MSRLRLAEIRLTNWKAYRQANLVLPDEDGGRVVVVGGANGAGKTSLLEALALGLYGRDGLGLVARASDRRRGEASYDGFLERALHRGAVADGRMSVELVFTGGPRHRVSLLRVWYFSQSGKHHRDDEDVRIFEGEDDDLLAIPAEGREAFIQTYVAEALLPVNLAAFLIFDGEHVERLAGQDLEGQVRSAVEAVMGVPLLRQTAQDLRTYARERRRETREADGSALGVLKTAVSTLEAREDTHKSALEAVNDQLSPLRAERDALVGRIGALHGDSYASFKGLFETREHLTRNRADRQEALRRALSVDLAFALTGEGLRSAVRARLAAEALRDQWQSGLQTSEERYAKFTRLLDLDLDDSALKSRVRSAWETVWNSPPAGAAAAFRHSHLGDPERQLAADLLDRVTHSAGAKISDLARAVRSTEAAIQEIEGQIAREKGVDAQSQTLADDLRAVQQTIANLEARRQADVEALDGIRAELAPRKQELGQLIQQHAAIAPVLRRAEKAEAYAGVLDDLVESALPGRMALLSEDVTAAYRAMAHKDEVERIEITLAGEVRLLNAAGEDLRARDASAGETQIFALALMAAIGRTSPDFPLIMDTPFARLDPQHRRNVLRHFAGLGSQLILLAHPAEIATADLADLGGVVAPPIEIVQDPEGGDRVSRIASSRESH